MNNNNIINNNIRKKKVVFLLSVMIMVVISIFLIAAQPTSFSWGAEWSGVDETVVEKYAEKYGRSAREPFINTDQGDLLLFVFCLAGTVGGFIMGYSFHKFFHEPEKEPSRPC